MSGPGRTFLEGDIQAYRPCLCDEVLSYAQRRHSLDDDLEKPTVVEFDDRALEPQFESTLEPPIGRRVCLKTPEHRLDAPIGFGGVNAIRTSRETRRAAREDNDGIDQDGGHQDDRRHHPARHVGSNLRSVRNTA
jgi:hypothetical protein